ncbi:hypothetical protein VTK56DRAFT_7077 [Thermocarpiscus australiensis]
MPGEISTAPMRTSMTKSRDRCWRRPILWAVRTGRPRCIPARIWIWTPTSTTTFPRQRAVATSTPTPKPRLAATMMDTTSATPAVRRCCAAAAVSGIVVEDRVLTSVGSCLGTGAASWEVARMSVAGIRRAEVGIGVRQVDHHKHDTRILRASGVEGRKISASVRLVLLECLGVTKTLGKLECTRS